MTTFTVSANALPETGDIAAPFIVGAGALIVLVALVLLVLSARRRRSERDEEHG